jgi:hypothetical protein
MEMYLAGVIVRRLVARRYTIWYRTNLSPAKYAVKCGRFVMRLKVRSCAGNLSSDNNCVRHESDSPPTF